MARRTVARRWAWLAGILLLGALLLILNAARLGTHASVRADPASHARAARLAEIDNRFKEGVAMLRAGRPAQAAVAFHRVLELAPRLADAHVNLGYALLGMERPEAARDFFLSAIEIKPDQVNAYYGLAVSLEALDDLPGALGAMRTYVHRAPADAVYLRKARAAIWEWEEAAKGKGRED